MPEFVTPQPGDRLLGKYVVERVLGAGGMGVVLAARHEQLDQRVAIKILSTRDADEREYRRTLREARAAVKIPSEHVARVLDFETDQDRPCIVMEYLDGEDLGRLIRSQGPQPITDAVGYVLQACEALSAAHGAGIIHRDLKPENLFLCRRPDGTPLVKVLDFGISKVMGSNLRDSDSTNIVVGSAPYMSPEQLSTPKLVDARADVWGIGVVLYELLAGRHPFTGDSLGTLVTSIMTDPVPGLCAQRSEVTPELEAVVMRCLVKPVAERIPSIRDLAVALMPWAPPWTKPLLVFDRGHQHEPTMAGVLESTAHTARNFGRRTRGALALSLLLLAALGVSMLVFAPTSRPPKQVARASLPRPAARPTPPPPIVKPIGTIAIEPTPILPPPASPPPVIAPKAALPGRRVAGRPRKITSPSTQPRPTPQHPRELRPAPPASADPLEGRK